MAPINPMGHGSIVMPELPVTGIGQFEGYNYLGIGVLGLLVLNVAWRPSTMSSLRDPKLVPLAGLVLACTLAALSSTVTFGSWTLVHYELPRFALVAAQSLRASGRLFWPAHYLLVLAALALTYRLWRPPSRTLILALALAFQVANLWTLRRQVRSRVNLPGENPLRSATWQRLGTDFANLLVIPPYQCGPAAARREAHLCHIRQARRITKNADEQLLRCALYPSGNAGALRGGAQEDTAGQGPGFRDRVCRQRRREGRPRIDVERMSAGGRL